MKTVATWRRLSQFAKKEDAPPPEEEGSIFELPEDLTAVSPEELTELLGRAQEAFDQLNEEIQAEDGAPDPTLLEPLRQLHAAVRALREEQATRAAASEEVRTEAANLAAELAETPPADGEGDGGGDGAETPPAEPETPPAETPPAEAPPEAIAAGGAPAKVPAVPRKISLNAIRARQKPAEIPDEDPRVVMLASADIPGVPMGRRMNKLDLAKACHSRARTLPASNGNGQYVAIASIENPYGDLPSIGDDPEQAAEIIRSISRPAALLAAGGWCAPSTPIYDFFGIECVGNLLDVPTVNITRGGITWPVSPSLADVLGCLWTWTEADDIAAVGGTPTKPCCRIPCPTFDEARLTCYGVCVTHGNLTDAAFPELTRRWLDLVLAAHERRQNALLIGEIVAGALPAVFAAQEGAAAAVLGAIEVQVQSYRSKFGMCCDDILEAVAPCWLSSVIRADLAKRMGCDQLSVSDAQIAQWFDERSVRLQYVADWQPFDPTAATALDWPDTVQILLYPAGTWIKGVGPTIDLGVVRDSTLNETNDYTALWTESCWLTAMQGFETRLLTIPLCPNGATHLGVAFPCTAR